MLDNSGLREDAIRRVAEGREDGTSRLWDSCTWEGDAFTA